MPYGEGERRIPRRAAVTGASGYIGSHLVEWLVAQDVEVVALAHSNSASSLNNLAHVPPSTKSAGIANLGPVDHRGHQPNAMFLGQLVHDRLMSGLPGQLPPTAKFRMMKNGLWNSSVPLMLFRMLAAPVFAPSTIQVIALESQLMA